MDSARPRLTRDDTAADASVPRRTASKGVVARIDDALVTVAVRTGVTPRAVLGLVLVAVIGVALIGGRMVLARYRSVPVPIAPAGSGAPVRASSNPASGATPVGMGATGSRAASWATGTSAPLVVYVVGQVRRAGVVRLPAGSRVEDAVAAAGGALRGADLTVVNLARLLLDGEQLVVPRLGQSVVTAGGGAPAGVGGGSAGGGAAGASGSAPLNLNSATAAQLDGLPGIGPVLAGRILDWRTKNGRFSTVDELGEISGIGQKALERLRPLVAV